MSTSILSRLESFLASLSTSNEERIQIQQHLLGYIDSLSTQLNIPQTTPQLYPTIPGQSQSLANFASDGAIGNETDDQGALLTSHSHKKLAIHTALSQVNNTTLSSTQLKSLQDLIKSNLPNNSSTSQHLQLQQQQQQERGKQPLLPELCSLYDFQHDFQNTISGSLITEQQQQQQQQNSSNPTIPQSNQTLKFQRTSATMAVSQGSANVIWYLTSSAIIGIDVASLVESQYSEMFRVAMVIPLSLQQNEIDLSLYNNITVNQTSTLAVLWSSTPKLSILGNNSTKFDNFDLTNSNNNTMALGEDQLTTPTNPVPLVIELPALEAQPISLFDKVCGVGKNDDDKKDKRAKVGDKDIIPISRTQVTFLLTEQLTILEKLYQKQKQLIALQQSQRSSSTSTSTQQQLAQKITKLSNQIATLSSAYQTIGVIQDIQFHALSPTTAMVLTPTTLSMYTLMNSMYNSYTIPLSFLPKKTKNVSQQAAMPTLFYDLNLLPYVCTDSGLEGEFGNSNTTKEQNPIPLTQTWVKMVYIPLPTTTASTSPTTPSSQVTSPTKGTTTDNNHNDKQEKNEDLPPISFTYAFLSSTGLISTISSLIPHMFWSPTDLILNYRTWIAGQAFPTLIGQIRSHYRSKEENSTTTPSQSLSTPLNHLPSLSINRWVTLLAYIDQIFGLVPKSPFMEDPTVEQFFAMHSPSTLTDVEILSALTLDLPSTEHLISDILYSDCIVQTPVMQLCGYVHNKLYQRFPQTVKGHKVDWKAMQYAEKFIDCTLLPLDIPILASVSVINNHQYRLPEQQRNTTADDKNEEEKCLDHGQQPSAFLRLSTHYTLLSTAIQRQYTSKTHLYSGFVYSPQQYYAGIENYHKYVIKYRNLILSTKKRDIPVGNILTQDSFTQRLIRLSTPVLSTSIGNGQIVAFGNNNAHNLTTSNETSDIINNTKGNAYEQFVSTYLSNRQFSLGQISIQLTNIANHLNLTLNGTQSSLNQTDSYGITTAHAVSLPLLTASGCLGQYHGYNQVPQMTYIDTSFLFIHLPDNLIKLSAFKHFIAQAFSAAINTIATQPAPAINNTTQNLLATSSLSSPEQTTPATTTATTKPARRRKLGFNFALNDDDTISTTKPGPDNNNSSQSSATIPEEGLLSPMAGTKSRTINNNNNNNNNSASPTPTPSNTFSTTPPAMNNSITQHHTQLEQKSAQLLETFSNEYYFDDQGNNIVFHTINPKHLKRLDVNKIKSDIIQEMVLDLAVNLRQKQLQEALISLQLNPIQHYLYPTITQSYLPGLQIQSLPCNGIDEDDEFVIKSTNSNTIGVKHTSLTLNTSIQTHSMAYFLTPKLLATVFHRVYRKYTNQLQPSQQQLQPQSNFNPFFGFESKIFTITLTTLIFFFHGISNSTIFSNVLSYYNTIDNTKMAQIQKLIITKDQKASLLGSQIHTTINSNVNTVSQLTRANPSSNAYDALQSASPSTQMSQNGVVTQLGQIGSVSYIDTITQDQPLTTQPHNSYHNHHISNSNPHFIPVSPYHLPLSLLYCYASIIPPQECGVVVKNNQSSSPTTTFFINYLSTSLISNINNAGGSSSSLPITLSLSSMYLGTTEAIDQDDSTSTPFTLQYDPNVKFYAAASQRNANTIAFNHDGANGEGYDNLSGQFRPVKKFALFVTRQVQPVFPHHHQHPHHTETPNTNNNDMNNYISQFRLYPFPLPKPIYTLYSDLLLTDTHYNDETPDDNDLPMILTHPSTLQLRLKYPQHDLNTPLEVAFESLKDEYFDVIATFEENQAKYITPNLIGTNDTRQTILPTNPHMNITPAQSSTTPTSPHHHADNIDAIAFGSAHDVNSIPLLTSITDFIARYTTTLNSTTPTQSLAIRIDQEGAQPREINKGVTGIDGKPSKITITPTDDDFIHEVSDRILVIQRDCYEVKLHLQISLEIMTELSGSTRDFAQYLLQSFVILESNLDAMIEKYNLIAHKQEILQKKLTLLNEKFGSLILAKQQELNKDNEATAADLLCIDESDDESNKDGGNNINQVNAEIKLIPNMNKNPGQIYNQLVLLQDKINEMDDEMTSFKNQQYDLMTKQCKMFGIGLTIEPSNNNKNNNNANDDNNQQQVVFAPVKEQFQNLLGDIVGVYNTLLSYRVRIQAAQNELDTTGAN